MAELRQPCGDPLIEAKSGWTWQRRRVPGRVRPLACVLVGGGAIWAADWQQAASEHSAGRIKQEVSKCLSGICTQWCA